MTARSVVRNRPLPLPLDFPCLGLGNLTLSQPSCFLRVAWQLGTERVLQLNSLYDYPGKQIHLPRPLAPPQARGFRLVSLSLVPAIYISQVSQSGREVSSSTSITRLKRKGERGQPCLTPLDVVNSGIEIWKGPPDTAKVSHDRQRRKLADKDKRPTRSVVPPYRYLAAMPSEGSTRAEIPSGCPSLDKSSRNTKVGFEPQTFRSCLENEFTDQKVRGSNPTSASASRLPLSRLGQPGSTSALVLPPGGMAARHRKGATDERTNDNPIHQGW
ncbi:hypothetical protein CSKR_104199 [Clonorchis sinensis]|uniref:Uncharacterized protein n=1 Tax=Clonorchis sinensis TaxID=79923 RepID=A0A419Q2A4_CLOSI|nr:hypothetical protein CSKR_104199 [Clonorchis sinensis]